MQQQQRSPAHLERAQVLPVRAVELHHAHIAAGGSARGLVARDGEHRAVSVPLDRGGHLQVYMHAHAHAHAHAYHVHVRGEGEATMPRTRMHAHARACTHVAHHSRVDEHGVLVGLVPLQLQPAILHAKRQCRLPRVGVALGAVVPVDAHELRSRRGVVQAVEVHLTDVVTHGVVDVHLQQGGGARLMECAVIFVSEESLLVIRGWSASGGCGGARRCVEVCGDARRCAPRTAACRR